MYHVLLCSFDTKRQAENAKKLLKSQDVYVTIAGEYFLQAYQGKNKSDAEMYAALLRSKGFECVVRYYQGDVE